MDNCPVCGKRISDWDMSGCEDETGQRYCVAHLPEGHPLALELARLVSEIEIERKSFTDNQS